jgi:hypothetical protein
MKTTLAWLACALALVLPAHAQKACSKADAAAAEKAIDKVVSYGSLNKAWKDWRHCDSGNVEDVFTDAILRLMVQWKDVETIAVDVQRDPEYKQFIHAHLASDAAKDDRPSIYSRAKGACPLTQGAFCADLIEAVKAPGKKDDLLAPLPVSQPPASAPPKK